MSRRRAAQLDPSPTGACAAAGLRAALIPITRRYRSGIVRLAAIGRRGPLLPLAGAILPDWVPGPRLPWARCLPRAAFDDRACQGRRAPSHSMSPAVGCAAGSSSTYVGGCPPTLACHRLGIRRSNTAAVARRGQRVPFPVSKGGAGGASRRRGTWRERAPAGLGTLARRTPDEAKDQLRRPSTTGGLRRSETPCGCHPVQRASTGLPSTQAAAVQPGRRST
jgi:hypothetical protein